AQELGIRGDREFEIRAYLADDPLDLVACPDRHGRLGHDDRPGLEKGRHFARRRIYVAEVRMAVAAPRGRTDGNEHRVGPRQRLRQIDSELEPPGTDILRHEFVESGLEN